MINIDHKKVKGFEVEGIDCEYTNEIVCPYCGYEWTDSWEEGIHGGEEDIGELKCYECEKHFFTTRNITIDYSTITKEEHDYFQELYSKRRTEKKNV